MLDTVVEKVTFYDSEWEDLCIFFLLFQTPSYLLTACAECKEKGSVFFSDGCVSKTQCEFQGNVMKGFA